MKIPMPRSAAPCSGWITHRLPALLALFALAFSTGAAERLLSVDTGEFGPVSVYGQKTVTEHFAVMFSSEAGLTDADRQAIDGLVEQGMTVAAVDTRLALQTLKGFDKECLYLPGPLEWVSHAAQRQLNFPQYSEPLLLGRGEGGLLVYASLAQAPPLSFPGGASADLPSARLSLGKKFCNLDNNRLEEQTQTLATGYLLEGWWRVGGTTSLSSEASDFVRSVSQFNKDRITLLAQPAPLLELYGDAAKVVLKRLTEAEKAKTLDDLPLVEVSAQSTTKTLAIIYSGDGGWRDLDRSLGDLLKAKGFAVLGVDALRYFWSKRTPDDTARDLARMIVHYRQAWGIEKVVLVGYSFGADILPFAYNRLPADLQAPVRLLSLLAPSIKADFAIQVSGWFGGGSSPEALPLSPEIGRIAPTKLQCFYGTEEAEESLCMDTAMKQSERISRPGGHHFDENYSAIAEQIMAGVQARQ